MAVVGLNLVVVQIQVLVWAVVFKHTQFLKRTHSEVSIYQSFYLSIGDVKPHFYHCGWLNLRLDQKVSAEIGVVLVKANWTLVDMHFQIQVAKEFGVFNGRNFVGNRPKLGPTVN